MTIFIKSSETGKNEYNILINSAIKDKIIVIPDRKNEIAIPVEYPNFELSVVPVKTSYKFKLYNIFKMIITVLISYLFFAITWKSGFPANDFFRINYKKKLIIKNCNLHSGKIYFEVKSKKINQSNIFVTGLNISHFENLNIEKQESIVIKDFKILKFELCELISFYIFWFLPLAILSIFLLTYGISVNNFLYAVISLLLFIFFGIICLLCVIVSVKIYMQYKSFLEKQSD